MPLTDKMTKYLCTYKGRGCTFFLNAHKSKGNAFVYVPVQKTSRYIFSSTVFGKV